MKHKISLKEILVKSALSGLNLQRKDGSFPAGHNGPWNDLDTPIRTTAHWSILLLKAYKLTKNSKFKNAAEKAGSYLISKKCQPHGFSFFCRRTGKNRCNGLIGQAWVVEALIELGNILKQKKYLDVAEDVVLKHHFNKKRCLWYNLEIDGTKLNINITLNQQIWFAVMAYKLSLITNNDLIKHRTISFFKRLSQHICFNGKYITHLIHPLSNFIYRKESRGYLSFVLTGLAHINNLDSSLLSKTTLKQISKSIDFLNDGAYQSNWKFCWSYNPTGLEAAYILYSFKPTKQILVRKWIEKQLKRHFNFKTGLMNRNTSDPNTLAARIYEATRLPDMELKF